MQAVKPHVLLVAILCMVVYGCLVVGMSWSTGHLPNMSDQGRKDSAILDAFTIVDARLYKCQEGATVYLNETYDYPVLAYDLDAELVYRLDFGAKIATSFGIWIFSPSDATSQFNVYADSVTTVPLAVGDLIIPYPNEFAYTRVSLSGVPPAGIHDVFLEILKTEPYDLYINNFVFYESNETYTN